MEIDDSPISDDDYVDPNHVIEMTLNSLPVPNPAINVQLVMDEGPIPNSMYNTGQPANMENQFSHDNVYNNVEPNIPLLPPASFIPEPHSSEQNRYPIYPMQPKQMQQHSINTNHFPTYPYHDQQINNPYHETDQIYHQQQWLQETSADNIYPVPSSNTNSATFQHENPYIVGNYGECTDIPGFYPYDNESVYPKHEPMNHGTNGNLQNGHQPNVHQPNGQQANSNQANSNQANSNTVLPALSQQNSQLSFNSLPPQNFERFNNNIAPPIAEFQNPIGQPDFAQNVVPTSKRSSAPGQSFQESVHANQFNPMIDNNLSNKTMLDLEIQGIEMSRFLDQSEHAGDIAAAVALDTNKARQHFILSGDGLDSMPKRTEVVTEEDGRAILFESKNDALLETRTVGGRRYKLKSASKMAPNKRKARIAANNRERRRMKVINDGFTMLRGYIPIFPHETKLSKIDTLKLAMHYITVMDEIRKTPLSELYKDERYYGCHLLNSERSMADKLRAEAENGPNLMHRPIFTIAQTNRVMDRIYADIESDIQAM